MTQRVCDCGQCRTCQRRVWQQRYEQTPKGQRTAQAYRQSAKGKRVGLRYNASRKGQQRRARHEPKRVRYGGAHLATAPSARQAQQITAHVRQRMKEFACRYLETHAPSKS